MECGVHRSYYLTKEEVGKQRQYTGHVVIYEGHLQKAGIPDDKNKPSRGKESGRDKRGSIGLELSPVVGSSMKYFAVGIDEASQESLDSSVCNA